MKTTATKIILGFLFSLSFLNSIAQNHVQEADLYKTVGTGTISKAFPAASTTGDLIIVHLDWGGSAISVNASGVTDSKGNAYHKITSSTTTWNGGAWKAELWYAYNITGGSIITVSATFTGTPSPHSQIYISEYSSMLTSSDPFDKVSVGTGTSGGNISSGFQTTTYANELVYGVTIGSNGNINPGAGFNSRNTDNGNVVEDLFANGPSSNDTHFTNTAASGVSSWVVQMATFQSNLSPLPIELISFNAKPDENKVLLNWATATETNNNFFTILRSQDGVNFDSVSNIKGAGNSVSLLNYSYYDNSPYSGTSYYRLKQTDCNGAHTYSDLAPVYFDGSVNFSFTLYPNPGTSSEVKIVLTAEGGKEVLVVVYDMAGNETYSKVIIGNNGSESVYALDPSGKLAPGVYMITATSQNSIYHKKLIIQ